MHPEVLNNIKEIKYVSTTKCYRDNVARKKCGLFVIPGTITV